MKEIERPTIWEVVWVIVAAYAIGRMPKAMAREFMEGLYDSIYEGPDETIIEPPN